MPAIRRRIFVIVGAPVLPIAGYPINNSTMLAFSSQAATVALGRDAPPACRA
ncbi:hypothetical protein [Streptomyces sp. NPDC054765]